ncbi:MAG: hypothetical protein K1X68_05275 [Saprospiraceae bacterium]|nr:hypothetical protein [Saprospiraceae bacterium]HMW40258.1 hypothetical protein [Saprospiraceae bacterium]HMX89342.1 hypothetical protein [Saprospiraceae bacterium]HMZ40453.1 hypothetical protein [Saprospiraceae bacterium]HNA64031.1 hypothetical protein [Saprospiraceae bacterium]
MVNRLNFNLIALVWLPIILIHLHGNIIHPVRDEVKKILSAPSPKSNVSVSVSCTDETIVFAVANNSNTQSDEFTLSIIEDDIVLFIKTCRLNGGEMQLFPFEDEGIEYKVLINFKGKCQEDIEANFPSCKNKSIHIPARNLPADPALYRQRNDLPIIDIPSGILTALCFDNALIFISKNEDHLLLC